MISRQEAILKTQNAKDRDQEAKRRAQDPPSNVGQALQGASCHLQAVSDTPRAEAEILLMHVIGSSRAKLLTHPERPMLTAELEQYEELIDDRARGYPLPYLTGKDKAAPRDEVFYFSDDGDLTALRFRDWKLIFMEQRVEATLKAWFEPFVPLRAPLLFNLRRDPYERATLTSNTYWVWYIDHAFLLVPTQDYVAKFLATFKEYPPRQKAASFTIDQVMDMLQTPSGSR